MALLRKTLLLFIAVLACQGALVSADEQPLSDNSLQQGVPVLASSDTGDVTANKDKIIFDNQQAQSILTQDSSCDEQVKKLQVQLSATDTKQYELSKKFIALSLSLTQKENEMSAQAKRIEELNTDLADLQSRFELSQQLLAQKNSEMQALAKNTKENSTVSVQSENPVSQPTLASLEPTSIKINKLESTILEHENKLVEFSQILSMYKKMIQESKKQINSLEEKLKSAVDQLHQSRGIYERQNQSQAPVHAQLKTIAFEDSFNDLNVYLFQKLYGAGLLGQNEN